MSGLGSDMEPQLMAFVQFCLKLVSESVPKIRQSHEQEKLTLSFSEFYIIVVFYGTVHVLHHRWVLDDHRQQSDGQKVQHL
jgi:hypothetical protein